MHWGDQGPAITPLKEAGFDCPSTNLELTEDRIRWILNDVASHRPDVFVPNLVIAGYYAARWIKDAGIPTVGIVHSDDLFYHAILDEFVFGKEENRLNSIVAVSRKLEDDVNSRHPRDTAVHRIPYGVSIPNERVTRSTGLRLAYVGRLAEEQKRISDVVRAMADAVAQVPGTSGVIYGDGPDRQTVERLINSVYAGRKIVLGGLVDSEHIQHHMLQSDVIVLLSDYEGLPIALIEAMACGCVPICLAGDSGISELIVDGLSGIIVRDRGADFVEAVRTLSTDPEMWSKLSQGARETAELFAADVSADAWATLFKGLASQSVDRGPAIIPTRLTLSPVNPHLASADIRAEVPKPLSNFLKRARMIVGRWRRSLLRW
jgi:glycosyltransferase involved in cell wall biosynthesis